MHYIICVRDRNVFDIQDIHNIVRANQHHIQQHFNLQQQSIQQHLNLRQEHTLQSQQQVVVQSYGNVQQRSAARATTTAKAKSLTLEIADRDVPVQGGKLRRRQTSRRRSRNTKPAQEKRFISKLVRVVFYLQDMYTQTKF